jgi:hypothetical protein
MFITICSKVFSPYEGGGAMVRILNPQSGGEEFQVPTLTI